MALGGISRNKIIPYVPIDDRETEFDKQTVFWIKPKKFGDANITLSRYAAAEKMNSRKGFREFDARKLTQADKEEFSDIVVKVENWKFSADFGGNGERITPIVDNEGDLEKVCRDMPNELLNEVIEVANDMSKLTEGEKKSLNSSVFSTSGNPKDGKSKEVLTAISVGEQE